MRAVFALAGLLLVVAIVGLLARQRLTPVTAPATARPAHGTPVVRPTGTPQQQVQQFKQAIDANLQVPARELPDEAR